MGMRRVLLIVSGSIAAYKSPEIIRRGQERGWHFTSILTAGGAQFITPLTLASIAGTPCYTDLFSLKSETEMGHIRLSREADLILVAPASADLIAKMANGRADDLATALLLAANKPVAIAPAMNAQMWNHPATQANIALLQSRGVHIISPGYGEMACHEEGAGRMEEPLAIVEALAMLAPAVLLPLAGRKAVVTAGPTHEPIDPVRYIGNRSSGKQGYAIAAALAHAGADVTLVSGPTALPCPLGVKRVEVQTAEAMYDACLQNLPADIAVCTAAVADWRVQEPSTHKYKKQKGVAPSLSLEENPDILKSLSTHAQRPALVIGFAAETQSLEANAKTKLLAKGCDWIVANDVSDGVFGEDNNHVMLLTRDGVQNWPRMSKQAVAAQLISLIIASFNSKETLHAESSR